MAYFFTPDTPFYEEEGELPPIPRKSLTLEGYYSDSNNFNGSFFTIKTRNNTKVDLGYEGLNVKSLVDYNLSIGAYENTEYGEIRYVSKSSSLYPIYTINDLSVIPENGLLFINTTAYNSHLYQLENKRLISTMKQGFVDLDDTFDFSDNAKYWLFSQKITNISLIQTANTVVNGVKIFKSLEALGINKFPRDSTSGFFISKEIYDNYGYSFTHEEHTNKKGYKTFFVYLGQNDDCVLVFSVAIRKIENHPTDDTLYKFEWITERPPTVENHYTTFRNSNGTYTYQNIKTSQAFGFFIIPKRNTWKKNNHPTTGFDVKGAEYLPDLPINTAINKVPSRYLDFLIGKKSRAGDLWIGDDVSIELLERMINLCFYYLYNSRTRRGFEYTGHEIVNKKERRKTNRYHYQEYELQVIENSIIPISAWDKDDVQDFNFRVYSDGYNLFQKRGLLGIPNHSLNREYIHYNLLSKRPKPVRILGSSQDTDNVTFQLLNLKYSRDYKKLNLDEVIDSVKEVARQYACIMRGLWGRKNSHNSEYNDDNLENYFFFREDVGNVKQHKDMILSEINSFSIRQVPELERSIRVGAEITPYMLYYLIVSISNIIYKRVIRPGTLYSSNNMENHDLKGCHASTSCHSSCHSNCHRSQYSCHTVYVGSTDAHRPDASSGHYMSSPDQILKHSGHEGFYWDTSVGGAAPPGWQGRVV